ncbi:major facilitator superfamily domain-containing protein [Exophiala viscosa]|uniref:major facilitator superfamily domain-containing protein n=1 Tax=Exophiala viscosa TaxID=2486360 RepID=UPI002195C82C|nr:major facilitator superfamily domain-containing protein [Exophiala viscosa]
MYSAAWAADGFDYNSVNLVATELSVAYNENLTHITLSVTLTLVVRAFGAVIFGILADMFGRKWVMVANLWILAVLQIGTAEGKTFGAFVGVRTIFGICMGGIYGPAAAIAMENMPVEARGLFSGILQNGYAMGYVLAAMVTIVGMPDTTYGYRVVFYAGAGFSAVVTIIIMCIPESAIFAKGLIEGNDGMTTGINPKKRVALFFRDARLAARQNWKMSLYCVLFTSIYNWMTHACQDIYPSYLKVQKGFTPRQASLAAILGQCGAIIGRPLAGYYSQFFGRRLTSIVGICLAWAFIPLFTLPTGYSAIMAGTFCLLFFVNASWGIMPILLNEYSPPQFRAVFPGTVYQLGNMFSAPAAQSQTAAASDWIKNGKPNYSQVMTIFMCVLFASAIAVCACGPERLGSHFEVIKRAGAVENPSEKELELRESFDSTKPRSHQLTTIAEDKVASKEQIELA